VPSVRLTLPPVLRVKRAAAVWRLMRAPKQNVKEFLEKRRRATKRVLNEKKSKESVEGEVHNRVD